MPKVTVIPSTIDPLTHISINSFQKKKVCAYARVSTDSDEQFTSYQAQVDYYSKYIKTHNDWEFVDVYTDEGISGTSTKKRSGFNQMIKDALDGKIDLIVTKSVSRFARNTVDALVNIRKLKEKGIEVYFEKENIYTLDSKGELLLTIMSSTAQEESRSISENITWGKRKSFQDGKVFLPYGSFLGYKKGENGLPEIVPKEAEIVRMIYRMYLNGKSIGGIAAYLTKQGIKTPGGKTNWRYSTVDSILRNEKYKGSALLQKRYTVDYLTKTIKKNQGEVPQYYVEESHPAIISPEDWAIVESELHFRDELPSRIRNDTVFSGKVVCGDCGSIYGPKVWHSTEKYRKIIWQCNSKFDKDKAKKCSTPNVNEEQIKECFVKAIAILLKKKDDVVSEIELIKATLFDKNFTDPMDKAKNKMAHYSKVIRDLIYDNARKESDIKEYMETYVDLTKKYTKVQDEYNSLMKEAVDRKMRSVQLQAFIDELNTASNNIIKFDDRLFNLTTKSATVNKDNTIDFLFKDGRTIKVEL